MLGITPILSNTNSFAASDTLPGGTSIEVTISTPFDGEVFQLVGAGVDVDVEGTASVGTGTPIKDTTVVYILDLSGSMTTNAGVNCDGVGGTDSRLVCAQEGIIEANQAAADAFSSVDETGLGSFRAVQPGTVHDVDLGTAGLQRIVDPNLDGNSNSTPDLEDVVSGLTASGGTNYCGGLQAAATILQDSTNTNNIVIFISDGLNNQGNSVNTCSIGSLVPTSVIKAFAIGTGVTCSNASPRGDLDDVAARGAAGSSCAQVTDISDLADEITESIGSSLTDVDIDVDNSGAVPANSVIPLLPQNGPVSVAYAHLAASLGAGLHDICAIASGTDAGGSGSVDECVTILVNTPPDCSGVAASTDTLWPPNHKLVEVTLSGATDADNDDVTLTITGVLQDEPTNGLGDGDESPDAFIDGDSVELRAERSGNGDIKDADGRVYEISFSAEDENGGTCSGSVIVGVPHDKKDTPIDSGLDYDSTS